MDVKNKLRSFDNKYSPHPYGLLSEK